MFDRNLTLISDEEFSDKQALITYLSNIENVNVIDPKSYKEAVLNRESVISTSVGYNIAIPHAISSAVKTPFVIYLKLNKGLAWDGDKDIVNHIFMIGVPEIDGSNQHLKIISELSKNLMRDKFRNNLFNAPDEESVYNLLKNIEREMMI